MGTPGTRMAQFAGPRRPGHRNWAALLGRNRAPAPSQLRRGGGAAGRRGPRSGRSCLQGAERLWPAATSCSGPGMDRGPDPIQGFSSPIPPPPATPADALRLTTVPWVVPTASGLNHAWLSQLSPPWAPVSPLHVAGQSGAERRFGECGRAQGALHTLAPLLGLGSRALSAPLPFGGLWRSAFLLLLGLCCL